MLSLLSLLPPAVAAPLDPMFERGPRSVKIDIFWLDPRGHTFGSDWTPTLLEQWTVVLSCTFVSPTIERCRFVDDVWWSAMVLNSTDRVSRRLPIPGVIEWSWTPRGRLKAWDVLGDRSAFWTEAANAQLQLTYHRSDVIFKPDAQRDIGGRIERGLTRALAGAVEWEFPKELDLGLGSAQWTLNRAPWSARRFHQSTSSARLNYRAIPGESGVLRLSVEGSTTEQESEIALATAVTTQVVGSATWDARRGGVVESTVETFADAGLGFLVGHARSITVVGPWAEGDSTLPADPPDVTLGLAPAAAAP